MKKKKKLRTTAKLSKPSIDSTIVNLVIIRSKVPIMKDVILISQLPSLKLTLSLKFIVP